MVKFDPSPKEQLTEENVRFLLMKHTGEEILAYVLEDKKKQRLYIFQPAKVNTMMNPMNGTVQYVMSEWISQRISCDEGFEVLLSDVLVIAEVEVHMLKTYMGFCDRMAEFKHMMNDESADTNIPIIEDMGSNDESGGGDELSPDDEELLRLMASIPQIKPTIH